MEDKQKKVTQRPIEALSKLRKKRVVLDESGETDPKKKEKK